MHSLVPRTHFHMCCWQEELSRIGSSRPRMGGISCRGIAALLGKHPNSVAKWLNRGLRFEHNDPEFKSRLDHLEAAISERS